MTAPQTSLHASVPEPQRDEAWLQQLLDDIWDSHFADIPQTNDVRIVFGRRAKRRLGSIALDPHDSATSIITVNSLFRLASVPEFVVRATLVHELTHYAHGFNSPLQQRQRHPHAGGVMRHEFAERGLLDLYLQQKRWLKDNWAQFVDRQLAPARPSRLGQPGPSRSTRRSPSSTMKIPKPFWFLGD